MNKVAIRVIMRMLDTLVEQVEELRYHRRERPLLELDATHTYLKQAKHVLANLHETRE